jgi:hypothetical protein
MVSDWSQQLLCRAFQQSHMLAMWKLTGYRNVRDRAERIENVAVQEIGCAPFACYVLQTCRSGVNSKRWEIVFTSRKISGVRCWTVACSKSLLQGLEFVVSKHRRLFFRNG